MKILGTADWQAALSNLDRLGIVRKQLLEIIQREKIDYLLHFGDLKEHWNPIDQRVTNFLIETVSEFRKYCRVIILPGNHDYIAPRDGVPSILPVMEAAGAIILKQGYFRPGGVPFGLYAVPYIRDPEKEIEAFREVQKLAKKAPKAEFKILAFHTEVEGSVRSIHGKGKGIPLRIVNPGAYDLCLGGHIHYPQRIGTNLWYVGSPFPMDWSEINSPKGFLLVDTNSGSCSFIESEVPGWYDPEIVGMPLKENWDKSHIRIHVPVTIDPSKEIRQAKETAQQKYPGAIIHTVPVYSAAAMPSALPTTSGDWMAEYLKGVDLTDYPEVTREQLLAYINRFLPPGNAFGLQGLDFMDIEAQNVLCFDKVKLKLDKKGLTLVTGRNEDWGGHSNGSGKSSLLSLPVIALFGESPKGQRHEAWAMNNCKAPSGILLTLQLPDGRILTVCRGRRPSKLIVRLGQQDVSMGDANYSQRLIEHLTGITWDVLINSLYIRQHEIGTVFGTDKERKELFSHLLGLNRFIETTAQIKKYWSRFSWFEDFVSKEVQACSVGENILDRELKELVEAFADLPQVDPKALTDLASSIDAIRKKIQRLQQMNLDKEPWLEANQKRFVNRMGEQVQLEKQIRWLRDLREEANGVRGECPTCGGTATAKSIKTYTYKLTKQIQELEEQLSPVDERQNQNRATRQLALGRITDRKIKITNLGQELQDKEQQLSEMEVWKDASTRVQGQINKLQAQITAIQKDKTIHEQALASYQEQKRFVDLCLKIIGRDGLPNYLVQQVTPQLNAAASQYSEIFTGGEIGVQFDNVEGEVDVQIRNLHGGNGVIDQSEGEMKMAGLISAFAFREVLVPHNILILDEPGDGLDSENAKAFAKGLQQVVDRFGSVFLISHNSHILGTIEPDYQIEVTKRDTVSSIREIL